MTRDTAGDAHELLRRRAEALARREEAGGDGTEYLHLLQFHLADERYAVEQRFVAMVHPLRQLTPLPCTPPPVLGVVNVQGRIIPVIDLKKFFGLPERGLTDLHRVIQVDCMGLQFGLLADMGVGLARVARDALQPSLATLGGIGADYLLGVTADGLVALDVERIAADPRIVVDEQVVANE